MPDKKIVLFIGQNPRALTGGNNHMMQGILKQLDKEKYQAACFVKQNQDDNPLNIFDPYDDIPIVQASAPGDQPWGHHRLMQFIAGIKDLRAIVFVGLDIWVYAPIYQQLRQLCDQRKIKWITIFPYDLQQIRLDWIAWINMADYACVYSKYGKMMLDSTGLMDNLRYFKPPYYMGPDFMKPYPEEERLDLRHEHFPFSNDKEIIFGFVGCNQLRKNVDLHIKAFFEAKDRLKETNPDLKISLYLHTAVNGEFNINQWLEDYGFETGDFKLCRQNYEFTPLEMRQIYNCIDVFMLCSMQEGLSWCPLEAMMCGTPVIVSNTTAHPELVKDAGILVPCQVPTILPSITKNGPSFIDVKTCKVSDMADAMVEMATDITFRRACRERGLEVAAEWFNDVSNINDILDEALAPKQIVKTMTDGIVEITTISKIDIVERRIPAILFIQHSSAGDVLMSTQCLKGIKEKHPGMKLVYMTQKQYQDIITGNPYIDEIIDWDREAAQKYEIVYNPHGEKILPGGFNNLDVKLADMYPYFCKVKADKMFIQEVKRPDIWSIADDGSPIVETLILPKDYIIVHNSGGSQYRIYKHMDLAIKGLGMPVVQIGGAGDLACHDKSIIDLRGKLTWRETAWVMKRAKAAICVDSFPMHLAGALGTPVVAIYGPAPARVTGPLGDPEKIINLEADKLAVCAHITNCYGEIGCSSPCINSISPITVRKALDKLLEKTNG